MSVALYVQSVHIKYYIFSFKYCDFLISASSVGDRPLPSSGSWVISNTTIYTEGMPRNASTLMDPESRIHRAYREGGGDPPPLMNTLYLQQGPHRQIFLTVVDKIEWMEAAATMEGWRGVELTLQP